MARLGYWGFTVTLVERMDGKQDNVLVWAGGGVDVVSRSKLYNDLDHLLDQAEEDNKFMHFTEIWQTDK